MNNLKFILKQINCFVCDLAAAYTIWYILLYIRPTFFPVGAFYFLAIAIYFAISHYFFRASLMQYLLNISIESHRLRYLILKIIFVSVIPFCLTFYHNIIPVLMYTVLFIIVNIFVSIRQLYRKAKIKSQPTYFKNKKTISFIGLVFVLFILLIPLVQWNDIEKRIILPASIPEKSFFAKNINKYKQEPEKYIQKLYEKYDIVVFSERLHSEYKQWEFFQKIIFSNFFAENIQNIFVEIGHTQNQEKLNSFLNTHFETETELQRTAASLAREDAVWPIWHRRSTYDFLINLHKFNETSNSNKKIKLFYTDSSINWNTVKNSVERDSILANCNRDSLMAYGVINQFNRLSNKKCLVITNTRHAWNLGQNENEAAYICRQFPNKVATVFINGTSQLITPAMNGTLDAVAAEMQDSIWAIDLTESPLGKANFDLFLLKYLNKQYKDCFTGMIYCHHPSKWRLVDNYPFILDNYQDTLLKRNEITGGKEAYERMKQAIENGCFDEKDIENPCLRLFNLIFFSLHGIILIFLCINFLVLLFKKAEGNNLLPN